MAEAKLQRRRAIQNLICFVGGIVVVSLAGVWPGLALALLGMAATVVLFLRGRDRTKGVFAQQIPRHVSVLGLLSVGALMGFFVQVGGHGPGERPAAPPQPPAVEKAEEVEKPAPPLPKAGPFPETPAKRDLEAFALYHRLFDQAPGRDQWKAVARRLGMTDEQTQTAISNVAGYESDVGTWFKRKIADGEENTYGSPIDVSYLFRRAMLQVDFQSKALGMTESAKHVVKACLAAGALVAWRAVYAKEVTAPVKMVTIRVKQANHETGQLLVAAAADVKRETWEILINSGQFSVEKADLLSPRYSPWVTTP